MPGDTITSGTYEFSARRMITPAYRETVTDFSERLKAGTVSLSPAPAKLIKALGLFDKVDIDPASRVPAEFQPLLGELQAEFSTVSEGERDA